ncbi:TPA: hypothetical protein QDZ42_002969 [Stenotrophomonas maltophilia]|nr:hypothetical protein [Stenotrophomonas maltophilia]HDS1044294.1 hypothetical protein [Stenotrophomonas maltophilia]
MSDLTDLLESRLADGSDVYIDSGVNPSEYLEELANDIRLNACEPFELYAVVMAPGIPGFDDGEEISGMCVAKRGGRWLVYRAKEDRFYVFWGPRPEQLGAHGIFGSPLYCWSA